MHWQPQSDRGHRYGWRREARLRECSWRLAAASAGRVMIEQRARGVRTQFRESIAIQCCSLVHGRRSFGIAIPSAVQIMPNTLDFARRLLALSQNGLHFTASEYDRERYREIVEIATALLAAQSEH